MDQRPRFAARLALSSLALVGAATACSSQSAEDRAQDRGFDGSDPPAGGAPAECSAASECVLAASTCCECSSFGAPANEGYLEGCEDVQCQPREDCPGVEVVCDGGRCVMICSAVIADRSCEQGFLRDEAGCLVNTCRPPDDSSGRSECELDSECAQVPADCCGCERGGDDTAVRADEAEAHVNALACTDRGTCPDIDTCSGDEARCIGGSCMLAPGPAESEPGNGGEGALCGSPELPACSADLVCVLNAPQFMDASDLGLGVCQPGPE